MGQGQAVAAGAIEASRRILARGAVGVPGHCLVGQTNPAVGRGDGWRGWCADSWVF
jgi:hypothetical protein